MKTNTKIYIIRPIDEESGEWATWYDKNFGFVIEAESEQAAREMADAQGGDETRDGRHPWLDKEQSSCHELKPLGFRRVVISDFRAA